jgi:hypothetical protein
MSTFGIISLIIRLKNLKAIEKDESIRKINCESIRIIEQERIQYISHLFNALRCMCFDSFLSNREHLFNNVESQT